VQPTIDVLADAQERGELPATLIDQITSQFIESHTRP